MAISTNGTVLARLAGALYNTQMSNATYSEVKTLDPATLADALYARDFSASTDAAVATSLVTNLGLTSVTGLDNWVAAQLTAAGAHKGAKIVDLLNGFAQMTADTTYGAYATAFNTKVDAALAASQTTGNAGGTFAAAGVVVVTGATFALTAGVDTATGTAEADTFNATGATLGVQDTITGGAGTDILKIIDTTSASVAGLTGATITGVEALEVTANAGVGAFVTSSNATVGAKQVVTVTTTGATLTTGPTAAAVTINGQTYTDSTVSGSSLEGVNDNIKALIVAALGNSVTITDADATDGLFTITALAEGQAIPSITVATTNTSGEDYATAAATSTPGTEIVASTGAVGGLQTITLAAVGNSQTTADTYSVNYNGNTIAVYTGTTQASAATAIAAQINALAGSSIATAVNTTVTIQSAAGQPLPLVGVTIAADGTDTGAPTATVANLRSSADAATSATNAAIYNAAGFAEAFNASGAGDMNVKAASTAAVKLNNTSGKIVVDTAKTVDIVTTGSGTTDVTGKTLTTVSIKGGGNVTVDNLLNATAATTAEGTSMTEVTLNGISGTTAALKGAALGTVNITSQKSALTTTITNGTSKELTLNLTASGYNSSASAQTNRVDAGATAESITVNTVSKSNVDVRGVAVTALTLTGAGELTADFSNLPTRSIASTATGDLILGSLNAATTSVTTGAGADSFTLGTAVKTVRVSTGEGKDSVTVGQLVAGAAVDLGAGDDKVLGTGVVAAKTVADPGLIDGGAGNDVVNSLLLNAGNASRFINFEVLGLSTASATFDAALVSGLTGLELLVANSGLYTGVTKEMGLAVNGNIGSGSTTLTFGATNVVGTADSYTVTFGGKGATTSTATSRTSTDAGTLIIEGIENVNIVSNQASGFVNNTIDLTSAKLQTVTITGNSAQTSLGFTGTVGTNGSVAGSGGAVKLIDASTYGGIVTVSTAGITADDSANGLTIKTGSGKDAITLQHMATVDGGANDDAFVLQASTASYNSANSVLTGGTGKDSFDVSAIVLGTDATAAGGVNNTIASIIVTITDYTAGDTIDFSAGSEDAESALGSAVSTATATNLDGAITAIIVGAGTTHFAWGVYAGNTYVVHNADKGNGTDTAAEAGDVVVKLSGVYDLSLAAVSDGGVLSLA
jgi:hypothetical protein